VRDIKQTINREESKQMWHLIKRTVKDPHNPSVLKVQRVLGGETKEYIIQEEVENAIQRELEIRFSLAHSAPIMSTLLGSRLRYLGDEELARSIISGTFNIPADLDLATTLILKEIGKMGLQNNEQGRQRDFYHSSGIHPFLEKGGRVHILFKLGSSLWPLQSCTTDGYCT
jgi:hypothetical protein